MPVIALLASWFLPGPGEFRVRVAGAFITLVGVLQVVRGVLETQVMFGRPSYRSRVLNWMGRLAPIFRPRAVVLAASAAAIGRGAFNARLSVRANPKDESCEARIEALEKNLRYLEDEVRGAEARLDKAITDVLATARREQSVGASRLSEVAQRLETYSTGGLDHELAGIVWVIAGQAYGTFPTEIAAALERLVA